MKFKRISADTVRCFISSEELAANGLTVSDFMNSDGRCEEFIRKVVTLAQEEVDFKVYGGPMSIQVAALSEGTVALTFSEHQDMGIAEFLEALRNAVEKIRTETAALPVLQEKPAEESKETSYLFYVESMDDLMAFVERLPKSCMPECSLYKNPHERGYYLIASAGESGVRMADFITGAIEYMTALSEDDIRLSYVKEHMKPVIKNDALRELTELLR